MRKTYKALLVASVLAFSAPSFAGFDWEGREDFPQKPTWFVWFGW